MALAAALLIPLFTLLFMGAASGHDGERSVVYLDIFPNGEASGRLEHPVGVINELFRTDLDPADVDENDIADVESLVRGYNQSNLSIVNEDGTVWDIIFTGEVEALETENDFYGVFHFDVENVFDEPPRVFDVTFTGLIPDSTHFGDVVMWTDPVTGTFLNEGDAVPGFLRADAPTLNVNLDDPNTLAAFTGTVDLGMEHIFIGTDHILFVLVLILPAVMMFSMSSWRPVDDLKAALWRVIKIATAFTIAHSITLALGGLGIVELPSKWVETVIALSIVAAAMHNLRPVFANREPQIAFIFGIFHGFGFAGLLSDLGVGRGQRLLSLFGFNIGVEIGQVFIILLLFPALFMLRRTIYYPWIMKIGSVVLAAVATIWAFERIFETEVGIDSTLEWFTSPPRTFYLIAIGTVIAAAIRQFEDSQGRLVPVAGDDSSDSEREAALV